MGTKATYTDRRTGKRCTTPTMGNLAMAQAYVRNLKGATDVAYEDTTTVACTVVTAVDEGTAEKQRAASNAFYAPIKEARRGTIVREELPSRENQAELDMETYGAARAAGLSSDEAMGEVNYANGHR